MLHAKVCGGERHLLSSDLLEEDPLETSREEPKGCAPRDVEWAVGVLIALASLFQAAAISQQLLHRAALE